MPIVQSYGALQAWADPSPTWGPMSSGSVNLYGLSQTYAHIYATQPNVRICVDFLARNIAQLGLHVFRRVSDTDRVRLVDHDLARWMGKPNPATRRYRLIENLIADLGIDFNAYWLKVRVTEGDRRQRIGLVRLPPDEMHVEGGLLPQHFCWTRHGRVREFALSEVVHFNGYNPLNQLRGLSPLETLRRILAEESAAGDHRENFWRNASRHEGVIQRPIEAPKWLPAQKESWRQQWQERFAGGANAGMVPVLEDGMEFKATSFSAKDSEFTLGGKLRREVCAAAYHIPQPMVGILDHATFSNIKEQHKHLYQDCLGPWLEMVQEEIEGQLLIECEDQTDVYTEFNIAEKLKGSFEEQAASLQMLVGRPLMTANEGRARLNLPSITDDPSADELAPQQGGPASVSAPSGGEPASDDVVDDVVDDTDTEARIAPVLEAARLRQQAKLARVPLDERAAAFYDRIGRWNQELTADLAPILGDDAAARAQRANQATLDQLLALEAA